jgi:hypothetical protein
LEQVLPGGGLDTIPQLGSDRTTTLDFQTPIRIYDFNWQNSFQVVDERDTGRDSVQFRVDDPTTPDPTCSSLALGLGPAYTDNSDARPVGSKAMNAANCEQPDRSPPLSRDTSAKLSVEPADASRL